MWPNPMAFYKKEPPRPQVMGTLFLLALVLGHNFLQDRDEVVQALQVDIAGQNLVLQIDGKGLQPRAECGVNVGQSNHLTPSVPLREKKIPRGRLKGKNNIKFLEQMFAISEDICYTEDINIDTY